MNSRADPWSGHVGEGQPTKGSSFPLGKSFSVDGVNVAGFGGR